MNGVPLFSVESGASVKMLERRSPSPRPSPPGRGGNAPRSSASPTRSAAQKILNFRKTPNIQPPTSNLQGAPLGQALGVEGSRLDVGCSQGFLGRRSAVFHPTTAGGRMNGVPLFSVESGASAKMLERRSSSPRPSPPGRGGDNCPLPVPWAMRFQVPHSPFLSGFANPAPPACKDAENDSPSPWGRGPG